MQASLKYSRRSLIYLAMRIAFMALIVGVMIRNTLLGGLPADFLFFVMVAIVWFSVTSLVDFGVRRLFWADKWYDMVMVCMDVYFMVLALSLAPGTAGLAVLALAFYGFIVAVISSPQASLLTGISGMAAYVTSYRFIPNMPQLGLNLVLIVVLLGVVCGTAWRLCLPLFVKAVYFYLQNPNDSAKSGKVNAVADETDTAEQTDSAEGDNTDTPPPESDESNDEVPAHSAELQQKLAEREQELAGLREEKDKLAAELVKTNEELMALFENSGAMPSGQGQTAGADEAGTPDNELQQKLEEQEKELATLRTDKEKLAAELEKTNEELMKLFENSGAVPDPQAADPQAAVPQAAVPQVPEAQASDSSGGDDAGLAGQIDELKNQVAKLQKEKEDLAVELEKTNEEMVKLFRV